LVKKGLGTIRVHLGNRYVGLPKGVAGSDRARADEMEAQRGARPSPEKTLLQKALRPESRHRIYYGLPLENPASHRKTNRRVAEMHYSHNHPQNSDQFRSFRGGTTSLSAQ
jgi:hypothetical protein